MIQISAPSRVHVPEYVAMKDEVNQLVKKINRAFSCEGWIPVYHLYRSHTQEELSAFYREADVCFVTPLRDGMNLVAKEFIASQTGDPGVLVLSKFCGAADDLREAVIIDPYDVDESSEALRQALEMPLGDRRSRWHALIRRVQTRSAQTWCNRFLADLARTNYEAKQDTGLHRYVHEHA
jgi:trehalose-6-phosphate synthase